MRAWDMPWKVSMVIVVSDFVCLSGDESKMESTNVTTLTAGEEDRRKE